MKITNKYCECDACCPTIFDTDDGSIVIMGEDVTDKVENLKDFGCCAPNEKMVHIPKSLLQQYIKKHMK